MNKNEEVKNEETTNEKVVCEENKKHEQGEYEICFVFECKACKKINAIVDPKLVIVGIQGSGVSISCPACKKEHLLSPKHRIVGSGIGVDGLNRHARRKQKAIGLVAPNGKVLA